MARNRESRALDPKLRLEGVVPWSVPGLLSAIHFVITMPPGTADDAMLALTGHFTSSYRSDIAQAHTERFLKIARFVSEHRAQLAAKGMVGPEDGEWPALSYGLLRALTTARYTRRERDERAKDGWAHELDLEHVLDLASFA